MNALKMAISARLGWRAAAALAALASLVISQAAALEIPVKCNGNQVGKIDVNISGAGVSGNFISTVGTPPSQAAAAAACGEHHFNWYQTASGTHPLIPGGGPQVDPLSGGQSTLWADTLPWYLDEVRPPNPLPAGKTSPPTTIPPGGQTEVEASTSGANLAYSDFPGGPDGTNVMFMTWLVSLNADGSWHSWHPGFSWNFVNPADGPPAANGLAAKPDGTIPTDAQYADIIGGFTKSKPATVWDTVINNSPRPVTWGPGIWTRNGVEIGRTFPGGITQPPAPPTQINKDHKTLPETPNDFHFYAEAGNYRVDVWSKWSTLTTASFSGSYPLYDIVAPPTYPTITDVKFDYDHELDTLMIVDMTPGAGMGNPLYQGMIPQAHQFQSQQGFFFQEIGAMRGPMAMPVPEPCALWLVSAGLGCAFVVVRHRRRTSLGVAA